MTDDLRPGRNVVGHVTVTTDTSVADLLCAAGFRAVAIPDMDETLIEQLVVMYETTIWPIATLRELAKARRLATTLTDRGARPRWARIERLTTDLAEALATDAGRDAVRSLIDDAPMWAQPPMDSTGADSADGRSVAADLPAFPFEVLPPHIGRLAEHFAQAFAAPSGLIMPAMLAALSSALGPHWQVGARALVRAPSLWFALVAPPGMAKSPAAKPILRPLHDEDRRLGNDFNERRKEYARAMRDWKRAKGDDACDKPDEPVRERAALTDVTPEGLAAALAASPRGILVHSDEIAGVLNGMDNYHARPGTGRAFYLSLWSGERHAEGRKSAPQSESDNPFVAVFGTVQPSILSSLKLSNGDGLCARLLWLLVAPSVHGLGRDLNPELEALWRRVLRVAREHCIRHAQHFDDDALDYLDSRIKQWSAEAQDLDAAGAGLLAGMYGKAADHCVRFTALLHGMDAIEVALIESEAVPPPLRPRPVTLATVLRAARLVELYLAHGARVAALVLSRNDGQARAAEDDELLVCHLRAIVPVGIEIEDEPQAWADALAELGPRWSSSKIGRAFARLAKSSISGVIVTRPPRADTRQWRVRHLTPPSEVSEASVVSKASAAGPRAGARACPAAPLVAGSDASDATDASVGAPAHSAAQPATAGPAVPQGQGARLDAASRVEEELERAIRANDEEAVRAAHGRLAALVEPFIADAVETELRLEFAGGGP